jgi:hypothetical protein
MKSVLGYIATVIGAMCLVSGLYFWKDAALELLAILFGGGLTLYGWTMLRERPH